MHIRNLTCSDDAYLNCFVRHTDYSFMVRQVFLGELSSIYNLAVLYVFNSLKELFV